MLLQRIRGFGLLPQSKLDNCEPDLAHDCHASASVEFSYYRGDAMPSSSEYVLQSKHSRATELWISLGSLLDNFSWDTDRARLARRPVNVRCV
jgi:hypothetical protein